MPRTFVIWSDLHLNTYNPVAREVITKRLIDAGKQHPDAVILLAGDLTEDDGLRSQFFQRLKEHDLSNQLVVVKGNHDYYGRKFENQFDRVKIDDQLTIDYGTLWTNFHNKIVDAQWIYNGISDSRYIQGASQASTLIDAHNMALEYFRRSSSPVLVTHFPLFRQSIAARFRDDSYNPYFVNDHDPILALGRKLIVHGHVHDAFDYELEGARVICHPLGYPGEAGNKAQLHPRVVEIDI